MSIVSKLLVSGIILVLAGCGGSGNTSNTTSAAPVSPQNTAPTIDSFLTRTISDNGRVTLTWRVTDAQQTNLSCSISISGGISLSIHFELRDYDTIYVHSSHKYQLSSSTQSL